ncbi:hypothetical protein HALA3H3_p20031 [Halomonas sp. A3H3]|nr:hypothetical protein HALA3H3_p20031 [Halomonas sp. A3H3]
MASRRCCRGTPSIRPSRCVAWSVRLGAWSPTTSIPIVAEAGDDRVLRLQQLLRQLLPGVHGGAAGSPGGGSLFRGWLPRSPLERAEGDGGDQRQTGIQSASLGAPADRVAEFGLPAVRGVLTACGIHHAGIHRPR